MRVVVYNNKGGVGKTTLTVHAAFAAMEKKVPLMVVDADQQCNSMSWLSGHQWSGDAEYETGTVTVTTDVEQEADRVEIGGLIVVDAPPAFDFARRTQRADVWLIPVGGRFSVDGALNVIEQVRGIEKEARIVLVPNMCDPSTTVGRLEMEQVQKVGVELFPLPIARHDVVRRAEMLGRPVWGVPYGMRSLAAQNLRLAADWIIRGCPEREVYG